MVKSIEMKRAFAIALTILLAACLNHGGNKHPQKEYTAALGNRLVFQGVDLLSALGKPLEKLGGLYGVKVNIDDEVGVAFATKFGHPPLPEAWGLKLKGNDPNIDFISPGIADEHVNYSYDMLAHEAAVYMSLLDGYTEDNLKNLLAHALMDLDYQGFTASSVAAEFMGGTNTLIYFEDSGMKGKIVLAHFEGFALFMIKITDQDNFFG
jgi:hypothetical protein